MKRVLWLVLVLLVIGSVGCGTLRTHDPNRTSIESEILGPYKGPVHESGEITGQVPKVGDKIYVYAVIGRETRGPYENMVVYSKVDGTDESFRFFSTWGFKFPGLDEEKGGEMHRLYLVGRTVSADDNWNVYNKLHFYRIDGIE